MICYAPFTHDTIGLAGNLIADWEDENPTVRGVDGFPAFAKLRYGVYRAIDTTAAQWLDREVSFEDRVIASLDEGDDALDECDAEDDAWEAIEAESDEPVEGAISSFHCLDGYAPSVRSARGPRRVTIELAAPPAPVPPNTELVQRSLTVQDRLPARIGVHRAGRIAARR